jgi:hypothetical protein
MLTRLYGKSVSHGVEGEVEEEVTGGKVLQMSVELTEALISMPGSSHWQNDGVRKTTAVPSSG